MTITSLGPKFAFTALKAASKPTGLYNRLEAGLLNNKFVQQNVYDKLHNWLTSSPERYGKLQKYVKAIIVLACAPPIAINPMVYYWQGKKDGLSTQENKKQAALVFADNLMNFVIHAGTILGVYALTTRALTRYGKIHQVAKARGLKTDDLLDPLKSFMGVVFATTLGQWIARPIIASNILLKLKASMGIQDQSNLQTTKQVPANSFNRYSSFPAAKENLIQGMGVTPRGNNIAVEGGARFTGHAFNQTTYPGFLPSPSYAAPYSYPQFGLNQNFYQQGGPQ
ncbi:MAG: hypothetical protein KTR14_10930 [Vampirovibrio sp.]|nr:hypothetical protein [Vampirovibrio sp.]